jgi:hypothetical protein
MKEARGNEWSKGIVVSGHWAGYDELGEYRGIEWSIHIDVTPCHFARYVVLISVVYTNASFYLHQVL